MPIPGTTKLHRLEENPAAADVTLTAGELSQLKVRFAKHPKVIVAWIEEHGADAAKVRRELPQYHGVHYDATRGAWRK